MAKFKIDFQGNEQEIVITREGNLLHVAGTDQSFDLRLHRQEGPSFIFELLLPDGRRPLIHAAGKTNGDQRQMWVNGRYFTYSRVRERGSGHGIDGSLSAAIPAIVTQILVATGDSIAEGDKLILLESMKMVIPIFAPGAGVVKAIHCKIGDSVQAGVPLIELEAKET